MGDRANIIVRENSADGGVCLYTHWRGTDLPETLQRALAKEERWDDVQYLTRIIFCEMIGNDVSGSTGYGITSKLWDGDDRVLTVDVDAQTVEMDGQVFTFEEYIQRQDLTW